MIQDRKERRLDKQKLPTYLQNLPELPAISAELRRDLKAVWLKNPKLSHFIYKLLPQQQAETRRASPISPIPEDNEPRPRDCDGSRVDNNCLSDDTFSLPDLN